jgi:hypothetical protein
MDELEKKSMFVKEVVIYDGYYAEYIVTDGEYDLLCMDVSLPTSPKLEKPKEGTGILEIYAISIADKVQIKRADDENKTYLVERGKYPLSYTIRAKIIDKEKALVKLNRLIIELLDPLPTGLENGDFIDFEADRLDCVLDWAEYGSSANI